MLLRKYLIGTRITKVDTIGLERLLIIEFEGYNKSKDFSSKKLIIELMGKHSNIILTNSEGIIIDALKHFSTSSNSYRNIIPNAKYILPISRKSDFMNISNFEHFYQILLDKSKELNNTTLSVIISNSFNGISKNCIEYIIDSMQLENTLTESNSEKVYIHICEILSKSLDSVVCIPINSGYELTLSNNKEKLQVNFFIDSYYNKKEKEEKFSTSKANLYKLILNYLKKLNTKLTNINNKLEECKNLDTYRLFGELITNNLYRIENEHSKEIVLENYYNNNALITIPLEQSLSPSLNAKRYFKKYNKLKNAKEIVSKQKYEVEKEINYIESIVYTINASETIQDIEYIYNEFLENVLEKSSYKSQKKISKKKFKNNKQTKKFLQVGEPLKYTIDGFCILVGKNNKQNDYITKQANSEDIWFHTKDIHGSHVVLKTNGKEPNQNIINRCAAIAAYYSKANQSSNVSVDYTYIKYVKKPSNSKPGMVIYTNYKNVIVKPNCPNNK